MITRDFANNGQFNVTDWTEEVNLIPNQWGTLGTMGIFSEHSVAEHVVQFQEVIKDGNVLVDYVRGVRSAQGQDGVRKLHAFQVPHFPYDDAIYPQDIQGKRAYGGTNEAETFDAVRMRKMERIRQNHAWTLEKARAQALVLGTVYAPNGTVSQNWFTEFGVTQTTVDFLFGTPTTEIGEKIEAAIAAIQDNAGSVSMTGIVALCGTTWFANLIKHPTVKQAYTYYSSTQEPLRQRLAAGGSVTALHREFFYMGVRFIEMRDAYNGVRNIPATEAYFIPTGTDFFRTYFSPANRFGIVNTPGEQVYMFETMAPNGTAYTIETESNFVNALLKPQLVIKAITSN